MPTSSNELSPTMAGWKIVIFIFLPLTAIVGSAFIFLAPKITGKDPGKLYAGIRFENENTVRFMTYNAGNPEVRIRFFPFGSGHTAPEETAHTLEFFPARRGKNIFPIAELPDGIYSVQFEAIGFIPQQVILEKIDGDFRPTDNTQIDSDGRIMDQFVGIVMKEASARNTPAAQR